MTWHVYNWVSACIRPHTHVQMLNHMLWTAVLLVLKEKTWGCVSRLVSSFQNIGKKLKLWCLILSCSFNFSISGEEIIRKHLQNYCSNTLWKSLLNKFHTMDVPGNSILDFTLKYVSIAKRLFFCILFRVL